MTIFDTDPIDLPPVSLTRLEEDDEGQDLLDRLNELRTAREEAESKAREARRPLPDLMAEADELVARSMVGDADPEDADEAEAKVQEAKDRVETFRRRMKQCDRAASLLEEKIDERKRDLYEENAEAVRAVHRLLTRHALQAERRAATLLRLLREFEVRYARYSSGEEPESHPEYLPERVRTSPPRSIMGPARTAGGNVFDSAEATAWMRRAADLVDADPPKIIDVAAIDFTDEDAVLQTLDPEELDAEALDSEALGDPDSDEDVSEEAVSEEEWTEEDVLEGESPEEAVPESDAAADADEHAAPEDDAHAEETAGDHDADVEHAGARSEDANGNGNGDGSGEVNREG